MIEVGRRYTLAPSKIVARDGKTYSVFTVQASGRGWSSKQYFSPAARIDCTLEVEALAHDGYTGGYEKAVHLKIVNGDKAPRMYKFSKRPYVRKDGSFNVIDPFEFDLPIDQPFQYIYGIWNNTGYFHVGKDQLSLVP